MAQLPPDGEFIIQQIGGNVVLFRRHTEEQLAAWVATDGGACARAQVDIAGLEELNGEQKAMAHFWSGYFYAHARG